MATAIIGILVTPITEIAKLLVVPLKTRVGYLVKYNSNIELLRSHSEELGKMIESTGCSIDEARCRGEAVTKDVELWLKEVENIMFNVQKLLICNTREREKGNTAICCANIRKCYVMSKRAVKLLKVMNKVKSRGLEVPISRVGLPPSIEVMPSGDFEAFESTKVTMENIIGAVSDDRNKVIGVYGMGGVGKTSIIKEVAKHMKTVVNKFDDVVFATVSQNPVSKIQRDIAECLGIHLEEENEYVRSLRLADRLKLGRRTFIIFDDVWETVDFSQIGIPLGKDKSNCKIAITSRNRDVCSEMYCNVSIEVKPLSEEDSWRLFKKASGDIVESIDLRLVAKEVVRECGGLPIALVTVGRVLRNKEPRIWEDAAYELRQSRPLNIKGMHEKVFACLKISFDQFQNEECKLCYLYCSLFPEDYDVEIEDLLRYGVGEGLFSDVETIDEARSRVHSIISNLKGSCLLLSNSEGHCAKLHSVYRDLAITIATSDDYSFMVQACSGLKEWPRKPKLEYVMRMSLISNEFMTFTGMKEYPELILLLLQNNTQLQTISDEFFAGMTSLKVLDISNIPNLVRLPVSLSSLTSLRTLCVENNNLEDGSTLGGLTSLEILSLRKSTLSRFPEEIRKLVNLRLLDMTDTQIGSIPANVISGLVRLEELYMTGTYDGWEIARAENEKRVSLAEIFSLGELNTLHIDIGSFECLSRVYEIGPRLKKFQVRIGGKYEQHPTLDRSLCINVPDHVTVLDLSGKWIRRLLQTTLELSLKWKDLVNIEQLKPEYLQSVKNLHIQQCGLETCLSTTLFGKLANLQTLQSVSCPNLEQIFFFTADDKSDVFPRLSTIHIKDSPMLTALWRGVAPSVNLRSLKHLKLEFCSQIKTLFTFSIASQLTQLQILEISNCNEMEVLICHGDSEISQFRTVQTRVLFPELQIMKIMHLQNMRHFTENSVPVDLPALKYLTVLDCPGLKNLPFKSNSLQRLIDIRAEREWLEELQFDDSEARILLQNRFTDLST
ncbi:hypothetical protein RND81_11G061500 [Saponaria officinalis]|uniref:AAA+ ATPase domain-containing protein n=1 Tax=Saponaria officinalis TaxID=3572 RepID=A0AAW1HIM9_SAPOF